MDAQELSSLQEAYLDVYGEGYVQYPEEKVKNLLKLLHNKKPGSRKKEEELKNRIDKIEWIHQGMTTPRSNALSHVSVHSPGRSMQISRKNRLTRSGNQGIRDSYDYYDIILSHLLDEGYAETPEAAEVIMVNMSEEWRESIVEEYKPRPVRKIMTKALEKAAKLAQYKHTLDKSQPVYRKHLRDKENRGQKVKYPTVGEYEGTLRNQINKMIDVADTHDAEEARAKSKLKK